MKVAMFTGGRGSSMLSRWMAGRSGIELTVLINGYDDGASTGEIRRFLGDCLGPSDFRKNASRFATDLKTCSQPLIDLLDFRLPKGLKSIQGNQIVERICSLQFDQMPANMDRFKKIAESVSGDSLEKITARLEAFLDISKGKEFLFADCAFGNIIFAGCFLGKRRKFNPAVNDYCSLLNLPPGLINNVTQGENLFLVALTKQGNYIASEERLVDSELRNQIDELYLIEKPLEPKDRQTLDEMPITEAKAWLQCKSKNPTANPGALIAIENADLILYSPGTQHSSLYPSYITSGIGEAISRNLHATKLLLTNLYEDAEIPDFNAADIEEKALHYLRQKSTEKIPSALLITHSLINDPSQANMAATYIVPGNLDSIADPRGVHVGNFELKESGLHDAELALKPFLNAIIRRDEEIKVAVLMQDTEVDPMHRTGRSQN